MLDDLQSLKLKILACSLCNDLELGPKPIFQLDKGVKILIAGQAPGRLAHANGRPFDDPSGERLRSWLGVDRETFYGDKRIGIFPMGLCFPGTGSSGDKPPKIECSNTWRLPVMKTLQNVELTLVLGRYAIGWHLPELKYLPVTEAVRRSSDGQNGVFVLPHPSPRNNGWLKTNDWFEAQIVPRIQLKIARLLNGSPKD